jgi:AcrR family transcriptional regulator
MTKAIFNRHSSEHPDIHPTKKALIDTFLRLAEQQDFSKVRIENVLERSGISKGSLYHHFTDFDDLIAEAKAKVFTSATKRTVDSINFVVNQSKSAEDLKASVRGLIMETLAVEGVLQRQMRARILGASMKYPKLMEHVLVTQQWLTEEITETITNAKYKGLIKQDVDSHIAAVFIQTYVFGKIVDDISYTPVDPDDWADWIMSILDHKIFS